MIMLNRVIRDKAWLYLLVQLILAHVNAVGEQAMTNSHSKPHRETMIEFKTNCQR